MICLPLRTDGKEKKNHRVVPIGCVRVLLRVHQLLLPFASACKQQDCPLASFQREARAYTRTDLRDRSL